MRILEGKLVRRYWDIAEFLQKEGRTLVEWMKGKGLFNLCLKEGNSPKNKGVYAPKPVYKEREDIIKFTKTRPISLLKILGKKK